MLECGLARIDVDFLNNNFRAIADLLSPEVKPESVWAVFWKGEMMAVYLTVQKAANAMSKIEITAGQGKRVLPQSKASLILKAHSVRDIGRERKQDS